MLQDVEEILICVHRPQDLFCVILETNLYFRKTHQLRDNTAERIVSLHYSHSVMDTLVARMPSQPTPKVWQPWVTRDDTAGKISFRHTPV